MIYVPEGFVHTRTPISYRWGFAPWAFFPDSYLWVHRDSRRVMVSFIASINPGRGAFGRLVRSIERDGFRVAIPTPLGRMQAILMKWGFVPHYEDSEMGPCEVWERPR